MSNMRSYLIKDLERLSGVKAHTIRIWEQRYQLLNPKRTNTNIRHYHDNDLRKLLNISLLLEKGYKISKISKLDKAELYKAVEQELNKNNAINQDASLIINGMVITMIELDEQRFNNLFDKSVKQIGFQETVIQIIYPFLIKIGIMWGVEEVNPAQEHFISCLIRQKLIAETDKLTITTNQDKFVFFLPPNELHEIGLLLANYLAKVKGYSTYYLGQDVPLVDLLSIVEQVKPKYLFTVITKHDSSEEISKQLAKSMELCSGAKLLVTGEFSEKHLSPRIVYLKNIDDYLAYLK